MTQTEEKSSVTPEYASIGVLASTKSKYKAFSDRRLISLLDVADIAIEALLSLPREQQDALIERRGSVSPITEPASPQPAPIST